MTNNAFRLDVFTIFPELITGYCAESLLGKAQENGLLSLRAHDIRDHATDRHRSTDDAPYGGGSGMVMTAPPLLSSVRAAAPAGPVVMLAPSGRPFTQRIAEEYAAGPGLGLICGRYEGIDDRVRQLVCDDVLSVGDFVLNGGEAAALCVIEAVARLLPGAMGNAESPLDESFSDGLLEYPQFTRPASVEGIEVPDVLRSGDHAAVARWRRAQALRRTQVQRPDLYRAHELSESDRAALAEFPED